MASIDWAAESAGHGLLATGGADGRVLLRDARSPRSAEAALSGHRHEVCGLRWSPDSRMLVSGGNDHTAVVWAPAGTRGGGGGPLSSSSSSRSSDAPAAPGAGLWPGQRGHSDDAPEADSTGGSGSGSGFKHRAGRGAGSRRGKGSAAILHRIAVHKGAVKALSWHPSEAGVLATGGGAADRCLRIWDVRGAAPCSLARVDTGSQVCNVGWAPSGRELCTTHGYSSHEVGVWGWKGGSGGAAHGGARRLVRTARLKGHTARVLFLALAPDG